MSLVAIHQPNFLPWLGFFDKWARADILVLLDDVQFPKTGGTYINRVQLAINGAPWFLTVPVDRTYHGVRMVSDMTIKGETGWAARALQTMRQAYGKAPHVEPVFDSLSPVLCQPTTRLLELNLSGLFWLGQALGLDRSRVRLASEFAIKSQSTARLVELVRCVGGSEYLVGGGAGYQDDELFEAAGIGVRRQDFVQQPYDQGGGRPFLPGLSVIDAGLRIGWPATRNLIGHRA